MSTLSFHIFFFFSFPFFFLFLFLSLFFFFPVRSLSNRPRLAAPPPSAPPRRRTSLADNSLLHRRRRLPPRPPAPLPPGLLRRRHIPTSNNASSPRALARARRSKGKRSSVEPHGATILWLHLLRSAPESGNSGAPSPKPLCYAPFGRALRGAGAGAPFGALPNRV